MASTSALSAADRIGLVRALLVPFPDPADDQHHDTFSRIVETHGADTVFAYLRQRRLVNAALSGHDRHPAVKDPRGPFWLFREAGLVIRELHRQELTRIAAVSGERGIPLISYKGLALDLALGNTTAPSFSSDIDLLVRARDREAGREVLVSLGHEPDLRLESGRVHRLPARITRMTEESLYSFGQLQPYERLVPFPAPTELHTRLRELMPSRFCFVDGRLHFKISVDLHYTLNLLTDDIGTRVKPAEDDWWSDTQPFVTGDTTLTTLGDRTLAWTLLHRLYADCMLLGDSNIKALCHLRLMYRKGRLDTGHVVEMARRFPYIAPSLYYGLRAAARICDMDLTGLPDPEDIRATTAPLMNLGDCLPAFLDIGVAPGLDLPADPSGAASLSFRVF